MNSPTIDNDRPGWFFALGLIAGLLFWAAIEFWPDALRLLP